MAVQVSSGEVLDHSYRAELPRLRDALRLMIGLKESLAHHEVVEGRGLPPLLRYLAAWQSRRLARTYADLLRDPEFSEACRFFLSNIYAPQDFTQRDYDGTRIYLFMRRFLPEQALRPLALALELNELTHNLDQQLARTMQAQLGVQDHFTMQQYEEAYRLCDNYDDRWRQIELIVEVGQRLEQVRRLPFISTTLRVARGPAHRLGWQEMHDFLERGYRAWKRLRRVDLFLSTIEQREKAILNRIYGRPGGAPADNPYLVTDGGPREIELPVGE